MQQAPEESNETVSSFKQEVLNVTNNNPDKYYQDLTKKVKKDIMKAAKSGLRVSRVSIFTETKEEFVRTYSYLKKTIDIPFEVKRSGSLSIFIFKW